MQIKKGLKIQNIAGERILVMQGKFGMDMTKVISFNETAEWLWNTLYGQSFSSEDVIRLLIEHFRVDTETATDDAKKWIDQLVESNALE